MSQHSLDRYYQKKTRTLKKARERYPDLSEEER